MSEPQPGWVDRDLAAQFPGLELLTRPVGGPAMEDPGVQERLDAIAGRIRGQAAIELRREPIPAAYRAFFRHVGLDPDAEMTPVEAAYGRRLFSGGVSAPGPLAGALELAVLETAVPVFAFDSDSLDGPPGIRPAREGDIVTGSDGAERSSPGRLLVAEAGGPLCWLFEEPRGRGAATASSKAILLAAVGVPGVPQISLDEALDVAAGAIGA